MHRGVTIRFYINMLITLVPTYEVRHHFGHQLVNYMFMLLMKITNDCETRMPEL